VEEAWVRDWEFDAANLRSVPFGGFHFWHPPELGGWVNSIARGTYEPVVMNYLREVLTREMTFFDIGAHLGCYVLLAASRVRRVIAFEPVSRNWQVLLQNVQRNGLDNVTVMNVPMYSEIVYGELDSKQRFRPNRRGFTLATTLDRIGVIPDVIKIDVEGAEADVFLGGEEMLTKYKPTLVLELHPKLLSRFGRTEGVVQKVLLCYGYQAWTLLGRKKDSDVSWWRIDQ